MEFFKTPNIDYLKYRKYFYGLSALLAVVSIASLVYHKGPNPSIDFTGGTLVEGHFQNPVPLEDVRKTLSASSLGSPDLQNVPARNAVIIRYKSETHAKEEFASQITDIMMKSFPGNAFTLDRVDFVGPVVGRHLMKQSFMAFAFSMLGIIIYVAFRFKNWIWGGAGVFALCHDVFLALGFMSVTGHELSITVIAALLTLAGYSINDTIVIFDRIRENMNMRRKEPLDVLINRSLNETLSRTIITSLTVFMVLLSLLFFGGEVIHDFSLALTFGVLIGSYSTVFIATPLVYDWQMRRNQQRVNRGR